MSDQINLVEAFGIMVEHYDTYTKQLGMPLIKAFVNADAIKITFDTDEDTCELEARYKEEVVGSFSVDGVYTFTDYLIAIFQNVLSEHMNVSLEEAFEECASEYSIDGFMDLLTIDNQVFTIEVSDETILSLAFRDEYAGDEVSIIIPADPESISRTQIASAIHTC